MYGIAGCARRGIQGLLGDRAGSLTTCIDVGIAELNEAERLGAEAVETTKRILPEEHWHIGAFLAEYARTLAAVERFEEAESSMLKAHAILESALHVEHHHTIRVIEHLADLYDAWHAAEPGNGYDGKAAEWRAKLEKLQQVAALDAEADGLDDDALQP